MIDKRRLIISLALNTILALTYLTFNAIEKFTSGQRTVPLIQVLACLGMCFDLFAIYKIRKGNLV